MHLGLHVTWQTVILFYFILNSFFYYVIKKGAEDECSMDFEPKYLSLSSHPSRSPLRPLSFKHLSVKSPPLATTTTTVANCFFFLILHLFISFPFYIFFIFPSYCKLLFFSSLFFPSNMKLRVYIELEFFLTNSKDMNRVSNPTIKIYVGLSGYYIIFLLI